MSRRKTKELNVWRVFFITLAIALFTLTVVIIIFSVFAWQIFKDSDQISHNLRQGIKEVSDDYTKQLKSDLEDRYSKVKIPGGLTKLNESFTSGGPYPANSSLEYTYSVIGNMQTTLHEFTDNLKSQEFIVQTDSGSIIASSSPKSPAQLSLRITPGTENNLFIIVKRKA